MSMVAHSIFHRFQKSFSYAFKGIKMAFGKGELNIKIHIIVAFATIIASYLFSISMLEWTIVIGCIGIVIAAEIFNTAIEKIVDFISPEWNPKAGAIKDIAAGAVLVVSIAAALIGILIFLPKIIAIIH